MLFEKKVADFNRRSRYQINSQAIATYVELAMIHDDAEARDLSLKQIMYRVFPEDARNHERVRMEMHAKCRVDLDLFSDYMTITDHNAFLTDYIDVICECAKDIDPEYKPPFMLGLGRDEVKRMLIERTQSYTFYDDCRYVLFHANGLDSCREFVERARYSKEHDRVHKYSETTNAVRLAIQDAHVWKEIIKEELAGKSIWWKIRHPFKTFDMWSFMKTTEQALRDVQFTSEDGESVLQEYKAYSVTTDDDLAILLGQIDKMYDENEKAQAAPQSNASATLHETQKEPFVVDLPAQTVNTDVSEPVSQDPKLEKSSIRIN